MGDMRIESQTDSAEKVIVLKFDEETKALLIHLTRSINDLSRTINDLSASTDVLVSRGSTLANVGGGVVSALQAVAFQISCHR